MGQISVSSEVCDGGCPEWGSPGSVLLQTGNHAVGLRSLEVPAVAVKIMLGADLDFWYRLHLEALF